MVYTKVTAFKSIICLLYLISSHSNGLGVFPDNHRSARIDILWNHSQARIRESRRHGPKSFPSSTCSPKDEDSAWHRLKAPCHLRGGATVEASNRTGDAAPSPPPVTAGPARRGGAGGWRGKARGGAAVRTSRDNRFRNNEALLHVFLGREVHVQVAAARGRRRIRRRELPRPRR